MTACVDSVSNKSVDPIGAVAGRDEGVANSIGKVMVSGGAGTVGGGAWTAGCSSGKSSATSADRGRAGGTRGCRSSGDTTGAQLESGEAIGAGGWR